jgi:hypothetical protein
MNHEIPERLGIINFFIFVIFVPFARHGGAWRSRMVKKNYM